MGAKKVLKRAVQEFLNFADGARHTTKSEVQKIMPELHSTKAKYEKAKQVADKAASEHNIPWLHYNYHKEADILKNQLDNLQARRFAAEAKAFEAKMVKDIAQVNPPAGPLTQEFRGDGGKGMWVRISPGAVPGKISDSASGVQKRFNQRMIDKANAANEVQYGYVYEPRVLRYAKDVDGNDIAYVVQGDKKVPGAVRADGSLVLDPAEIKKAERYIAEQEAKVAEAADAARLKRSQEVVAQAEARKKHAAEDATGAANRKQQAADYQSKANVNKYPVALYQPPPEDKKWTKEFLNKAGEVFNASWSDAFNKTVGVVKSMGKAGFSSPARAALTATGVGLGGTLLYSYAQNAAAEQALEDQKAADVGRQKATDELNSFSSRLADGGWVDPKTLETYNLDFMIPTKGVSTQVMREQYQRFGQYVLGQIGDLYSKAYTPDQANNLRMSVKRTTDDIYKAMIQINAVNANRLWNSPDNVFNPTVVADYLNRIEATFPKSAQKK